MNKRLCNFGGTGDGRRNVITGATGLLGSHIAELLRARGKRVRALVRRTSDVSFLRRIGVDLAFGDLSDVASIHRAVHGADVVYHCAARVGDYGSWHEFETEVIEATRNLLSACHAESVGRVLHVSSITVYGHPADAKRIFTEDEPLGQNLWMWDYYCRSKIRAEELVRQYSGDWVIIRPSWIFGPRDRHTIPRMLRAVRHRRAWLIGRGDNALNLIYAADVADGAIRAANHDNARGQAYNLSSAGDVTQRQLFDALADAIGAPRVRRAFPLPFAFALGFISEIIARAVRLKRAALLTRYAVSLFGRPTAFSTEKARSQLGWQPRVSVLEGLRRTLDWLQEHNHGVMVENDSALPI